MSHLEYFLTKIARQGAPAIVPSFPSGSSVNSGLASPPPQPPPGSLASLDPPVKAGTPVTGGGGLGGLSLSTKNLSVGGSTGTSGTGSGGGAKTSAFSSDDFKRTVNGPVSRSKRPRASYIEQEPEVSWSAPTSPSGGDASSRMSPNEPFSKHGAGAAAVGKPLAKGLFRGGIKATASRGAKALGKAFGGAATGSARRSAAVRKAKLLAQAKKPTKKGVGAYDYASSTLTADAAATMPTARLDKSQVMAKGAPYQKTRLRF